MSRYGGKDSLGFNPYAGPPPSIAGIIARRPEGWYPIRHCYRQAGALPSTGRTRNLKQSSCDPSIVLSSPVVARCRHGVRVPGHPLDSEDVDTGGEQAGHVAASEVVGRDAVEIGFPLALLEDVVDRFASQPGRADLAGGAHRAEQRTGLVAPGLDPLADQLAGSARQEHPPVLPALPRPHGEDALGRVEVVEVETAELRPAQPRSVVSRAV